MYIDIAVTKSRWRFSVCTTFVHAWKFNSMACLSHAIKGVTSLDKGVSPVPWPASKSRVRERIQYGARAAKYVGETKTVVEIRSFWARCSRESLRFRRVERKGDRPFPSRNGHWKVTSRPHFATFSGLPSVRTRLFQRGHLRPASGYPLDDVVGPQKSNSEHLMRAATVRWGAPPHGHFGLPARLSSWSSSSVALYDFVWERKCKLQTASIVHRDLSHDACISAGPDPLLGRGTEESTSKSVARRTNIESIYWSWYTCSREIEGLIV